MRALAILGRDHPAAPRCGTLELEGATVRCAVLDVADPAFDPAAQPEHVLLRVLAFSVNYRDRALVLRMATSQQTRGFYVIGSDFVAEVLAVGHAVSDLAPGDRVIPDCRWPPPGPDGPAGIPSNHGSRELQVLRRTALLRIPPGMDRDIAACFSIGGQTAHSMVRRLQLQAGERVLLTAPRSNTALFVLGALAGLGVEVHGVSASGRDGERLRALGLSRLVAADARREALAARPEFRATLEAGGYHAVVDPFADLYLTQVVPMMAQGGRYITCGLEDQSSRYTGVARDRAGDPGQVVVAMMQRNLSLMGNCLGSTADLGRAVEAHMAGRLPVQMDSVFTDDAAGFLARTYLAPDRFGKVAFAYG